VKRVFFCTAALVIAAAGASAAGSANAAARLTRSRPSFNLPDVNDAMLSQGARMWFAATRRTVPGLPRRADASVRFGTNVDAASPAEDFAAGQSETAIGATGNHVLVAWNDATAQAFSGSPTRLEASGTGVGYSANGTKTFTDLVGLPNNNPNEMWSGDPSIVSLGDGKHFIVTSLYFPSLSALNAGPHVACPRGPVAFDVAVSVATVRNDSKVDFGNPVIAARGGDLCQLRQSSVVVDKPFASYNASSETFAVSYTRFGVASFASGGGAIEVVRATHVSPRSPVPSFGSPIVIWPEEKTILNTGASPAVANNGDIYTAWERNINSNVGPSSTDPFVYIMIARLPNGAASPDIGGKTNPRIVTLGQLHASRRGGVKSLDGTTIAGYNRGSGQDFPSVAYDPTGNRVVVEWNDASEHPLGDIFLRSLNANLDIAGHRGIAKVNDDNSFALHFMPAVSVRSDGSIVSSWYDRRLSGPTSTRTDYFAEIRASANTNGQDFRVTTGPTDWAGTGSVITPNFGDYTDNTSTGSKTYFAWSDGRIGVPQPFVAAH
jgi:hypothetical protein